MFSKYIGCSSGSIPEEFRHVRYGDRPVRPELYSVMHKLSSKYHMSKSQIEGSIIAIANTLFGREWEPYTPREEHDLNTLPSVPSRLLCNAHPRMMFQGKIKELCQQIHDSLRNRKINECFLGDIGFKKQAFIIKSLNCLLSFIN